MTRRKDIEEKMFAKNMRPVRKDGVLVLLDEIPESVGVSGSAIVMPAVSIKAMSGRVGTVVGVGKEVKDLKPGSRILLNKVYGTAINHDDARFCQLKYVSLGQIDAVFEGFEETEDYDYYRALF